MSRLDTFRRIALSDSQSPGKTVSSRNERLEEQEQAIKFLAWSNSFEAAWAILSSRTPEIFQHRDRVLRLAACRSMALVEWEEFGEHAEAGV